MSRTSRMSTKWVLLGIAAAALLLAGIVSFYASASPDGLTKVSEDKGFASTQTRHHASGSPFAGYSTKDVGSDRLSGGLAGVVGVVVVVALASGVVLLVRRRDRRSSD